MLKVIVITGNILYILFMAYNAVDERGQVTSIVQVVAPLGLMVLLALNIYLIRRHLPRE